MDLQQQQAEWKRRLKIAEEKLAKETTALQHTGKLADVIITLSGGRCVFTFGGLQTVG